MASKSAVKQTKDDAKQQATEDLEAKVQTQWQQLMDKTKSKMEKTRAGMEEWTPVLKEKLSSAKQTLNKAASDAKESKMAEYMVEAEVKALHLIAKQAESLSKSLSEFDEKFAKKVADNNEKSCAKMSKMKKKEAPKKPKMKVAPIDESITMPIESSKACESKSDHQSVW